jgi:hypothetical protein
VGTCLPETLPLAFESGRASQPEHQESRHAALFLWLADPEIANSAGTEKIKKACPILKPHGDL